MSGKRKFVFLGIFVVAAAIAFNFSGIEDYKSCLGTKSYQIAVKEDSRNALETINEAYDELGDNIEDAISPEEVQAEEEIITEDSIRHGEEAEEDQQTVVTKWRIPLVNLPVPKVRDEKNKLKIGFITDLHVTSLPYGNVRVMDDFNRKSIDYFIRRMNDVFKPNFIVINGDVIEGTSRPAEVGMEELSQCRDIFNQTALKKYWVVGNHDLRSVTKSQWKQALGINYTNKSFDINNYRIIILDSNFFNKDDSDVKPGKDFLRGLVSAEKREWLRKELESSEKKKIIFMHHPLISPGKSALSKAGEIKALLEPGNVIAVFSGHTEELFRQNVDGVEYFIIPGPSKNQSYPGSFAEITLDDLDISVKLHYNPTESETYRIKTIK